MGAASTAGSCVCTSLLLPCPVRWPAVAMGRFLMLDLVVRCSSTSGAEIEFWRPGTLCWSPVRSTLGNWKTSWSSSVFRGYGSGFLPSTAGRSFIGGTSAWSGSLLRVIALSGLWVSDCGLLRRRRIHARVWFVVCLFHLREWRTATSQYP